MFHTHPSAAIQCLLASVDSAFFVNQETANSNDFLSVLDNTEEII